MSSGGYVVIGLIAGLGICAALFPFLFKNKRSEEDVEEKLISLRSRIDDREHKIKVLEKKAKDVKNAKRPDTIDDLISEFNKLSVTKYD